MPRREAQLAERLSRALLLSAAALLSACDGYPTEDEPLHNPFHMSPPQRLELLNRLGDEANAGERWKYEVQDCRLVVERRSGWWTSDIGRHDLRAAVVELRSVEGEEGRRHELLISPAAGAPAPAFSSRKLLDAQRVRQLVQLLVRECAPAAQAGTQRSTT